MTAQTCNACGASLGSNPECAICIKSFVRSDAGRGAKAKWSAKAPRKGEVWLMGRNRPPPARLVGRLKLVIRMVRDHFNGAYTRAPGGAIFWAAVGITYVVAALDLMPDFLPVIGLLDDGVVLWVIVKAYGQTIGDYCRANRLNPSDFGLV